MFSLKRIGSEKPQHQWRALAEKPCWSQKMRPFDPEKDKYWRKVLKDWEKSGLNLSAFSRRENISLNSLCTWREVISRRDAAIAKEKDLTAKIGGSKGSKKTTSTEATSPSPEDFVPVVLTGRTNIDRPSTAESQPKTALKITFANGATMLVHEHCSPALLATVMELMETTHV